MPPQIHSDPKLGPKNSQGFVLLEVLVAMSLVFGVWMTSLGAYQHLVLKMGQQDAKRSEIRKESDAFEAQEYARTNGTLFNKGLANESARVSSRNRSMRTTTQSTFKDKY